MRVCKSQLQFIQKPQVLCLWGGRKRKSETTPTKGEGKEVKKSGEGNEEEKEEKGERVIVIE